MRASVTFLAAAFIAPVFALAATCPTLSRTLSQGIQGEDVRQLQQFLIEGGDLAAGNATGYFGPLTRAAVRSFQCREMQICSGSETANGWGRVGPLTRDRITQVCARVLPQPLGLPPQSMRLLQPPTVSLTVNGASSATLEPGSPFTLVWTSSDADACTLTNAIGGQTSVAPNASGSSRGGAPQAGRTIRYIFSCRSAAGTVEKSVSLVGREASSSAHSAWPSPPGASSVDAEMAPFIAAAGPKAAAWLEGDTLGNFLYGPHAQRILHGTGNAETGDISGRTEVACGAIATLSGLAVILIAGQSNASNSAPPGPNGEPFSTNSQVYNLNIGDGKCYRAENPILGADKATAKSQAFAIPLASQLIDAGVYERVLLVPVSVSGTLIEEWRPGGAHFPRIQKAIQMLHAHQMQPTFILWHQGEGNSGGFVHSNTPDPGSYPIEITPDIKLAGTLNWMKSFFTMVKAIRDMGVQAPVFPAVATLCGDPTKGDVIRKAQQSVADPVWKIFQGPDTDALPFSLRSADGCHFSHEGNIVHAKAWAEVIGSYLSRR